MSKRLLFPLLLVFLFSCVPQEKVARKIVRKADLSPILLLNAQKHFFSCYDKRDQIPVDSIVEFNLEECRLLNLLTDSIYESAYFESLRYHLEMFPGVKVYMGENIEEFLRMEPDGFVVTLAQSEYEQYWSTFRAQTEFEFEVYYHEMERLNFSIHNWYEISGSGKNEHPMQVAYSKFSTFDKIKGFFRMNPNTGRLYYQHFRNDIDLDELSRLFRFVAMKNATYIFNHILNLKVEQKMGEQYRKDWYLGYNLNTRRFSRLMYDKFVIQ